MTLIQKRTADLRPDQAGAAGAHVVSGQPHKHSEVIQTGPCSAPDQDDVVERWLQHQVAPVFDAMRADPSQAIPAEEVFGNIRAHHAKHLKNQSGI